jgi:putative transposase
MARPLRIFYPNAVYHVTCRGNERKNIFRDDHDRRLFLEKLKTSIEIYGVKVQAYVLMSNHFHLIVETPKANLSDFMRHFNIAYTGAYNRRHKRVGHLYQGRYKAILVDKDSYLLELSRYLHLNPVRIKSSRERSYQEQIRTLERYIWSSLGGYIDTKKKVPWITYDQVLNQVGGSRTRYKEFVKEGIKTGYRTPWDQVQGQVVLGDKAFLRKVKGNWEKATSRREQPSMKAFSVIDSEVVIRTASAYFKIERDELIKKRTGYRDERGIAMNLMYRLSAISQAEIGRRLGGLDYTAVSRERKRLRDKIGVDQKLRRAMEKLELILVGKG